MLTAWLLPADESAGGRDRPPVVPVGLSGRVLLIQNDSVPLPATMSSSCSAGCTKEQLLPGLRGSSAVAEAVPVKVPLAAANCPVPPVMTAVCWIVPLV